MANWNFLRRDASSVIDSVESVDSLNRLGRDKLNPNKTRPLEINNEMHKLSSPTSDTIYGVSCLISARLQNISDYHFQRKAIPVGPRFQAEIPDQNGPGIDNCKWLGTQIWPGEIGKFKNCEKVIGKGRSNCCNCMSPGTVNCIRRHTLEKRLILQSDLGPAFLSWKFDEMGAQVSKSWTPKERKTFNTLMKTKSCHGKKFLKHILKSFPNKCGKDVVSYYFNVHIPQRMGQMTRSSSTIRIDTDDEEEINNVGMRERSNGRTLLGNSTDVKAQNFLRPL